MTPSNTDASESDCDSPPDNKTACCSFNSRLSAEPSLGWPPVLDVRDRVLCATQSFREDLRLLRGFSSAAASASSPPAGCCCFECPGSVLGSLFLLLLPLLLLICPPLLLLSPLLRVLALEGCRTVSAAALPRPPPPATMREEKRMTRLIACPYAAEKHTQFPDARLLNQETQETVNADDDRRPEQSRERDVSNITVNVCATIVWLFLYCKQSVGARQFTRVSLQLALWLIIV